MAHLTHDELERAAYISGNVELAKLHAIAADWQTVENALDDDIPMDHTIQESIDKLIDREVAYALKQRDLD